LLLTIYFEREGVTKFGVTLRICLEGINRTAKNSASNFEIQFILNGKKIWLTIKSETYENNTKNTSNSSTRAHVNKIS